MMYATNKYAAVPHHPYFCRPFPNVIDWASIAIFAGSCKCVYDDEACGSNVENATHLKENSVHGRMHVCLFNFVCVNFKLIFPPFNPLHFKRLLLQANVLQATSPPSPAAHQTNTR